MIPRIRIDSAAVPGGGELHLYQHGTTFEIRVGRDALMSSRAHGSEDALADLAWNRLSARVAPQVLVGGLGMGFTAAAVLRRLPIDGAVTVAELVPAVVAWNRGPLAHLHDGLLTDPRLALHVGDVAALLRTRRKAFDLILLDVDNGPQAMTATGNGWLYGSDGLTQTRAALRPGGVLAVWSTSDDARFTRRLRTAGFQVAIERVHAHGQRGTRHVIWLAQRP